MNLHAELLPLARKFQSEAHELDCAFIKTCDPRALQGGAICEEADMYRQWARKLLAIVREMEGS